MHFVTFAFIEGKLYKHFNNQGTFVLRYGKGWGNDVVYGAIFGITDYDFYIRQLDSYFQCSKSVLKRNHKNDVHHRITTHVTPISFRDLSSFARLRYDERDDVEVDTYIGNLNHPKINQRLNKTVSYRIVDGIDSNFIKLYREVSE